MAARRVAVLAAAVLLTAAGATIQRDVEHYLAGVNQYIAEAKLDPANLPGEYLAIGRPQGPEPWKATDVLASGAAGTRAGGARRSRRRRRIRR